MLFDNRRISEIKPEEIVELVEKEIGEDLWLEFKQEPYRLLKNSNGKDREEQITELCKDVASIANVEGGYIIIGIKEENKIAKGFIDVENAVDFCKSITDICHQYIGEPIPYLEVSPCEVTWNSNQYNTIIIHIPPSSRRPHFVKRNDSAILVRRRGDQKKEMPVSELVDILSSRYSSFDTISSKLDAMHNIMTKIAGITQENKRISMSGTEDALEQESVRDLLHLMKLRFQKNYSDVPYYRIIAVPEKLDPDLFSAKQNDIIRIVSDPPRPYIRKEGFGFLGIPREISYTSEGWIGKGVSQQEIILLRNGFIELRCPLLSEFFQWWKGNVMPFAATNEPWLYPYAVCEYPVSFLRLIKSMYSEINANCKIYIQQEYLHIDEFTLVSGHPGNPFFGVSMSSQHKYNPAETDQPAIIKKTIEPDFDPDQVAYDLVRYVYSCFGLNESSIPLFDENHNFTP